MSVSESEKEVSCKTNFSLGFFDSSLLKINRRKQQTLAYIVFVFVCLFFKLQNYHLVSQSFTSTNPNTNQ